MKRRNPIGPCGYEQLGKLMAFQVCTVFLYGIQMPNLYRESPCKKTEKESREQNSSMGNKLGWMSHKMFVDWGLYVADSIRAIENLIRNEY